MPTSEARLIGKQKYTEFCKAQQVPLFMRPRWLNAVRRHGTWEVILNENEKGGIDGALVYYRIRKLGRTFIIHPPYTPYMGVWLSSALRTNHEGRHVRQKKVFGQMIDLLPRHDFFLQRFHYSIEDVLPFCHRGFKTLANYTFVLSDISDSQKIFNELKGSVRTDVRKASRSLVIDTSPNIRDLVKLLEKTHSRKRLSVPDTELIDRIWASLEADQHRSCFFARDDHGRAHAGALIAYDEEAAYYLMGGRDHSLDRGGAMSLVLWHAIREASTRVTKFDFEGSMIPSVADYFASFNAQPRLCLKVFRTSGIVGRLAQRFWM
jgi:hypothetical protein